MTRLAAMSVIDSMTACDATRSHEAMPLARISRGYRASAWSAAGWALALLAVVLVLGAL